MQKCGLILAAARFQILFWIAPALTIENLVDRIERVHIDRYQLYNCSDGRYIEHLTPSIPSSDS